MFFCTYNRASKPSANKRKPWSLGLIAVLSPIPGLILTSMWSLLVGVGLGIELLHYSTIPDWLLVITLLPLLISPSLGLAGIVRGIIRRKERLAWLEILLSVLGLVENGVVLYGGLYLGSRF